MYIGKVDLIVTDLVAGCWYLVIVCITEPTFCQKKAAQCAEVVQYSTAAGDVEIELSEVVGNQKQSLFAPIRTIAIGC